MRKLIISAIIVSCLVFAMNALGVPQQTDCCGGSASGSAYMSGSCCCNIHNETITMMFDIIDIQKEIIVTIKDSPKKQEMQKKLVQMEDTMKQIIKQNQSCNCCGGGMMMQNMPNNMQNMPMHNPSASGGMMMQNMPMYNPPAKK